MIVSVAEGERASEKGPYVESRKGSPLMPAIVSDATALVYREMPADAVNCGPFRWNRADSGRFQAGTGHGSGVQGAGWSAIRKPVAPARTGVESACSGKANRKSRSTSMIDIIIDILLWMFGGVTKSGAARPILAVWRIVAVIAALVFGAYALAVLINTFRFSLDPFSGMLTFFPATVAILCGWFALRGHRPESRRHMRVTMRAGLIVGGIGLAAGVIGPVIFTPESNQGPLLGIFITGPLGFIFGAAIGWFYGRFRDQARTEPA